MTLLDPVGQVGIEERNLIITATLLMLLVVVPVIIMTLVFAWKYRASNTSATYTPKWSHSTKIEVVIWTVPILIIIALGVITYKSTHALDPYRPLESDVKPITIEVVAMDWKWLFIYPEQGIATVNKIVFPANTPVNFRVTSDTVMNSFFIPGLGGQIYAMAGMTTKLHLIANHNAELEGISANYSGAGFSGMRFKFHGLSTGDFDKWVQTARAGAGGQLNRDAYLQLERPSERDPVRYFGSVAPGLFDAIVNRCVEANKMCMKDMMAIDASGGLGKPGSFNMASPDAATRKLLGLDDQTVRTYVGAMCSVKDSPETYQPALPDNATRPM